MPRDCAGRPGLPNDFKFDRGCPGRDHADGGGGALRQVDAPTADERAAIIDSNDGAPTIVKICDPNLGAEWQRPMRRRLAVGIKDLAAGSPTPMEAVWNAIPGGGGREASLYGLHANGPRIPVGRIMSPIERRFGHLNGSKRGRV